MFVRVCPSEELWLGEMRACSVAGRPVLLINNDGQISAFADRCAHQGFPLSRGRLVGTTLTCAAHEWQYDARSGTGLNPRSACLRRFEVQVRDGAVWIDLPETDPHHG